MIAYYKEQFPNYDDTLKIPKEFEDWSYHNDMMPCIGKRVIYKGNEIDIVIFQDYKDINLRERDDTPRYHFIIRINSIIIFQYSTDNWSMIEEFIESINYLIL